MKKVSMSLEMYQKKHGDAFAIRLARELGLDGIDLALFYHNVTDENDVYSRGGEAVREYFGGLRELADELGVAIMQTHGRLFGYGTSAEEDEAFIRNTEMDCIATEALGARYCVIHSPGIQRVGDLGDEAMDMIGRNMLRATLPFAKRAGIKLAIETHGSSRTYQKPEHYGYSDRLIRLIDDMRREMDAEDALCICVDTGHTNMNVRFGEESVGDFIRKCSSRIEVLHLHDNDGVTDQHKIPMTGVIDWEDVFSALSEIGYSGWYNLENVLTHFGKGFCYEEATFSIKLMRHMTKTLLKA